MLTTNLKDKLWDLRQRQNLAELMPLFSELKLKYPHDQELQCLEASLERSRGEIKKSNVSLKEIRETSSNEALNPRLFMEEGLNFLYLGDSYNGLEKFLACYSLVKNKFEEKNLAMQSLINAMISLDNLGQSFAFTQEEFNKLTADIEIPVAYSATIEMLNLYKYFRNGDLALIDSMNITNIGQAKFFKFYQALLPYHRFYYPHLIENELENLLTSKSELYLKSYRLRTLLKSLHPDDESTKKISEVIDRLYSWVWRFMSAPSDSDWSRIVMTLDQLEKLSSSQLSVDDSEKLTCALGWLGLLDPKFAKSTEKLLSLFRTSESGDFHKIHQLEKLVIKYLQAKLNKDEYILSDYKNAIKAHPLYNHPDIYFRNFIENKTGQSTNNDFAKILEIFQEIKPTQKKTAKTSTLVIDLRYYKIQNGSDAPTISQNMTQALELFSKNESISDGEFFSSIFGIFEFDSVIHNSKLYTILWRLKKLCLDQLDFKVKNGRIHVSGSWKNIKFIELPTVIKIMRSSTPGFFKNYSDSKPMATTFKSDKILTSECLLSINESLTRSDIEKRIGKSRPTCNRLINKWRSSGLLEIEGSGPSTRYRISKKIEYRGKYE
ncbi:MAG: helix-turn-helix domain-containing protein [Bacteriovorax sp.]|nr:helix-turn-helix domain-containing protein [Bacteriovorax sp.]